MEESNWLRRLWEQVRRELDPKYDRREMPRRIVKPPRPSTALEEED